MRLIDADVLEKEGWSLHRTVRVDWNTSEYQTKPIIKVPTIEPEPKWILCSERLPEAEQEVFVYLFTDHPYIAWVDNSGRWRTEEFYVDEDELPVAWLRLPKPYHEKCKE